jgi:hypothetical protein
MVFDTQTLTRVVERCFDLSMSGALPQEMRAQYLTQGQRLRELLMRLLAARFDAGSAEFKQATDAMHEANKALEQAAADLDKLTKAVGRVAEVAGYLDKALGLAGRVIT